MARLILLLLSLLIVLVGQNPIFAQLPVARLLTVFPPGGKVGSEFEISLAGVDLDEASQLHFSQSGITAKPKINETNGLPEINKFRVTISTNVAPGVYDLRVAGRFGISNPRSFVVGDRPETSAPVTNTVPANAVSISLNTTINGYSQANSVSFYKFQAAKGQRILIECDARAIDSRMDAALILYDAAGKELERNRSGGLIDFTPPAEGQYHLKVYDYLFRGGAEYFYRLAISTGSHIDFIFPPSGLAGTKSKYVLYGRNLPGGTPVKDLSVEGKPLEQLEVEIELPHDPIAQKRFSSIQKPADATLDRSSTQLSSPRGVSNPILVGFATGPVVAEQQPNDQPAQAQRIAPPCEYVGQFYPPGDRDWVTFEAKKGEVFRVEVFSERMGLPTDPFALIQRVSKNSKGEEQVSDVREFNDTDSNLGGVEYKTATRDPAGRFEVEESGDYRIQIRDLFKTSQPDPRLVYRLSLRAETPDFRLVAAPQPPPSPNKDAKEALLWTPLLRRGETMPLKVMAFRRDNFAGEIELRVENLPAGVTGNESRIEKDKNNATLLLTAAETAPGWVGPIKIVGRAKIGAIDVIREARGATLNWTVNDYSIEAIPSRLSRDLMLAVSGSETAPISIEASESNFGKQRKGGKLRIPIKVTRRADFNANLKLKAIGIGALDRLKEIEIDAKATNATVELDLAELKLSAGMHTFFLQTQTAGKYRNNPEAAKTAEEALKRAEKSVADLTEAIKTAPTIKETARKAALDSAARAKAADEAAAEAAKTADAAVSLAATANQNLAAAKTTLEQKPDDTELLAAKETAAKASEEAEAKSRAALTARGLAEKAANEGQARAKADAESRILAEKAESEAPAKLKEAEKNKELAANRAKETAKTAEPRDVTITVYSVPMHLKITPALTTSAK